MSERSILRLRTAPHFDPDRKEEAIVEVVRDGVAVATIYGSREGVHIVSERLALESQPGPVFLGEARPIMPVPSLVVPLLAEGEPCPWCADGPPPVPCLLCGRKEK